MGLLSARTIADNDAAKKHKMMKEERIQVPNSDKTKSLSVGVVLAREDIDHPWQDHRWRPLEVLIGVTDCEAGTVLKQGDGFVHYFCGTYPIELHRKDTPAYVANLSKTPPAVYVVACEADDDNAALPFDIRLVTVSPFEAQDFLDTGEDIVEAIPMAAPLQAWVEEFVDVHHVDEKFIKRRRDRVDIAQEKFGQEPLALVRRRQRRRYDA
jgi:hypothetical protein